MSHSDHFKLTEAVRAFLDHIRYDEAKNKTVLSATFNLPMNEQYHMGINNFAILAKALDDFRAPLELGNDQSDESEAREHSLQEVAAISTLSQHGLIDEYKRVLGDLEENLTSC